jgi:hypothetical protein
MVGTVYYLFLLHLRHDGHRRLRGLRAYHLEGDDSKRFYYHGLLRYVRLRCKLHRIHILGNFLI